jgi:hypothetical protein
MMKTTQHCRVWFRRCAFVVSVASIVALCGCKTDRELRGTGVGRGKTDPLVGNLIPKQNVPLPERGTGAKTKTDPLVSPVGGRNDKVGYTDDPLRYKGDYIPGKTSTPAALASRGKDSDELKMENAGGVTLQPAGATQPIERVDTAEAVDPLYDKLEKLGVKRDDRSLERENGQYVFRATKTINAAGSRVQFTGIAPTATAAVQQVLDQVASYKP